jgi:hypothetical protein
VFRSMSEASFMAGSANRAVAATKNEEGESDDSRKSRHSSGRTRRMAISGITKHEVSCWPNGRSSASRRTGRVDCNRDAVAGFAAAHG